MNPVSRTAREEIFVLIRRSGRAVASRREGLVDGDLDAGKFGVRHAGEVQEVEG